MTRTGYELPNSVGDRTSARRWLIPILMGVLLATTTPLRAEDRTDTASGESAAPRLAVAALDLDGRTHQLGPRPERRALVLVFLSTECPIANGYIPELNRLSKHLQAPNHHVEFFGVISDRTVTRAAAAKHTAEYRITFPILFDGSGELAAALGPTHTPEAFVVDRAGRVAYRGRIDDAWVSLGQRRSQVTRHDLADAIAASVAGRLPAETRTQPVGCRYESQRAKPKDGAVTYARDIAPLLQANCMNCHRAGEVAPFPLTSYEDAAKRAGQIAEVARMRFMPPWKPEPEFGHFLGERRLTESQIAMLDRWAGAGAPEGDLDDLPAAPEFADGWLLGEPDVVVQVPEEYDLPAGGRDVFRNFVIPLRVETDKLVEAVEFRPGNRRVVHHALFYLDTSGTARKKDAADPGPGYGSFGGPGFIPTGALGGWAPGGTPQVLPDGMGRYLRKGSDLVIQIHYHPSGKPESDQSTVGIHYVKRSSDKVVAGLMVLDRGLDIPAGAEKHTMSRSYTLPADCTLVGITPHMHLLGREMKATATFPDGKVEPLVWIRDWNFNWQDQYLLAQPMRLPKGTRLDVEAVYDNSEKNPLNPNTPPKRVTWGEQTTDEMFICFFLVTTDKPQGLMPLIVDNLTTMGRPATRRLRLPLP